ncbi:MAG: crossover junction endodeoxyribonuclease RuvC [Candidatus Omnitrophica bacterium]|nr:crossover junction endodeoxyribonuclease RuvC [Candidatus Omnitrophota bacterium]
MVILGIDPGLNATGYGLISTDAGRLQVVDAGVIHPSPRQPLGARLQQLYDVLAKVMASHQPSIGVLEGLYTHHTYLTTATLMAHARGVVCLAMASHHLEQVDYLPTRVKKALTGNGAASKEQVARMVSTWLGVTNRSWSSDTTDALALAIAHAHITQKPQGHKTSSKKLVCVPDQCNLP